MAEEALAISVYCAMTAESFRDGVIRAVNRSGDSDSAGSITGNLLGVIHGVGSIDDDLLAELEGREVRSRAAEDLYEAFSKGIAPDWGRYPPW